MSREAAERIVATWTEKKRVALGDAVDVARAYLALLTPGEDDERIAREMVQKIMYTHGASQASVNLAAQALAAKGARQREADARGGADNEKLARESGWAIAKKLGENGADFLSETNADETIAEMILPLLAAKDAR